MQSKKQSIVITGIGAISTFGAGVENVWAAIESGQKKQPITSEFVEDFCLKVSDWDAAESLGKRGLKYLRPGTQFLLGASLQALEDAGLSEQMPDPDELGVVVASNLAGMQSISNYDITAITDGPKYNSPMEAPNTLSNVPASHLAIRMKARALNTTIASGQCSGLDVMGYASKMLHEERARFVLVGGAEELNDRVLWFYHHNGVLPSERPQDAGRPYSNESTGWQPGEGAAAFLLETREQAEKRGARIYAEVTSWSSGFAPVPDKLAERLTTTAQHALADAQLEASDIGLVVGSANGFAKQDLVEKQVLETLFASHPQVPVTSSKGVTGELYTAGGLFQTLTALGAISRGVVPPTHGASDAANDNAAPTGLVRERTDFATDGRDAVLLLGQDLCGSTSAVVLRPLH